MSADKSTQFQQNNKPQDNSYMSSKRQMAEDDIGVVGIKRLF